MSGHVHVRENCLRLTEQLSCPLAKDGFPFVRFQLLFAQRNFLHNHKRNSRILFQTNFFYFLFA